MQAIINQINEQVRNEGRYSVQTIIDDIDKKVNGLHGNCTPSARATHWSAALNDYEEKKRAFYLGKMSGYNLAKAVLAGIKPEVRELKVVNAKVIIIEDYSYVAYIRIIRLLNNIIEETTTKINNRNDVQGKRLMGQSIAISDIVADLQKIFFADQSKSVAYNF